MEYFEYSNGATFARRTIKSGPSTYIPICSVCHGRDECTEEYKERKLSCPEKLWDEKNPPSVLQDTLCIHL